MGLFSPRKRSDFGGGSPSASASASPARALHVWSDPFGRLASRALQIILVVALLAGAIWGLRQLTVVVIPLLLALILASAFSPLLRWLKARGLPPLAATLLTFLLVIVVLASLVWLIVGAVRGQWDELSTKAQAGIEAFVEWTSHLPFSIDQAQLDAWIKQATDFLTSAQFGSGAIAGVSAVASFGTGFVLLVVVLFFFLKDGPQLWAFVLRPFNGEQYERAERVGAKAVDVFGSYVRGTATVAAVDAIGILIGLLILQVPLAIPLAVLVFVLAFIPLVGATVAGILAAAVALVANGWLTALLVVGVVVLVNQLEGNLLQPVVMGRSMKLHAFVVLIALTIGTVLGGILGAILAVPITAVVWGAIQVWDGPNMPARWARRRGSAPA